MTNAIATKTSKPVKKTVEPRPVGVGFRLEGKNCVTEFWVLGSKVHVTGGGDSAGGLWESIEAARNRWRSLVERGYVQVPYSFAERQGLG